MIAQTILSQMRQTQDTTQNITSGMIYELPVGRRFTSFIKN
jgi:hypothetical protein